MSRASDGVGENNQERHLASAGSYATSWYVSRNSLSNRSSIWERLETALGQTCPYFRILSERVKCRKICQDAPNESVYKWPFLFYLQQRSLNFSTSAPGSDVTNNLDPRHQKRTMTSCAFAPQPFRRRARNPIRKIGLTKSLSRKILRVSCSLTIFCGSEGISRRLKRHKFNILPASI